MGAGGLLTRLPGALRSVGALAQPAFPRGLAPWAISVGDGCVLAPTPFSASSAQIVFPCFWSSFPDFSLTLLTLQE